MKQLKDRAFKEFIDAMVQGEKTSHDQMFQQKVEQEYERLIDVNDLNTSPAHTEESILREMSVDIDQQIAASTTDLKISDDLREKLRSIAVMLVTKDDFGADFTGLVFAGFGEVEHFPSMQTIRVGGIALDSLKQSSPVMRSVSDEEPSVLAPFAQSEMVTTFLEGINPQLRNEIIRVFMGLALEFPGAVIDAIDDLDEPRKAHWKEQFQPDVMATITKLLDVLKSHRMERHQGPVHSALIHLPKDELAHVAEALVNLNSFQKKVSMEDETVGGPIDVAVISKGDGFVWIKRKHYFSRELNEHYFNNLKAS